MDDVRTADYAELAFKKGPRNMRCIFCKQDSSSSRSVEHIIPESLGNAEHVLPRGVVCDPCNNYFAREVERPFLSCQPISHLRFEQGLPSKRGRVPTIPGALGLPGFVPVEITKAFHPDHTMSIVAPPEVWERVVKAGRGSLTFLASNDELPAGPIVSRFMAKVAVEAVAKRLLPLSGDMESFIDEKQFDRIRDHARRGGPITKWPISARRIYPADKLWGPDEYQLVHEFDILITERSEWFFVLAVFGLELVINYEGPDIDGYHRWLCEHGGESPLYMGKDASSDRPSSAM
jgi:HNH endonuclease